MRLAERRRVVEHFRDSLGISVRRACWLVNLHRKTFFYRPGPDKNAELARRLRELAAQYPRYGSEMLYHLLRREMPVNHTRVNRIYEDVKISVVFPSV